MLALLLLNRMSMKRRSKRQSIYKTENNIDKNTVAQELCRTCLSAKDLVSLFYNKETEKKRSDELKLVTGLEIKMDDELSQKICLKCVEAVNNALTFRRTCRKAEKTLLSMTPVKKTKRKFEVKSKNQTVKKKNKKIPENHVELNYDSIYDGNDGFNNDDFQNDDFNNVDAINESFEGNLENDQALVETGLKATKKRYTHIPNASSYKCPTCNKEFKMKSTFKAHMRFHTNYCVCESCGKRCRNNNQLQEHKRARHGLGRIHKCAYCEYSSATKEALVIHERRHTGERPYVCDHCGATFHRRSNLVQHIAIHLPEKNFQCDMCPKRLKSRKFLQIHKHNAHTGRRYGYLCAVCAHRFEKPNKVRAHTRRVHGLPDDQQPPIVRVLM
ncbi:zinc finger protein 675-like isoform X2 [Plodia interpunctella]|uniref:zinc finger protein 675-like isoform X2 n=1 Tax=Plodia interpunctella TaxID=58824 RepID=UPI002367B587|nr:zinc finger protein 675-like isoform X2 [Plodia interpunctella]